jgi:hypothetical protein
METLVQGWRFQLVILPGRTGLVRLRLSRGLGLPEQKLRVMVRAIIYFRE